MLKQLFYLATLAICFTFAPLSWVDDNHSSGRVPSEVASVWFDQLYDIIKSEAVSPPPASRIYGITSVALYESVVKGSSRHRSLARQLNEMSSLPRTLLNDFHWPTVANAALANTIRGLFIVIKPENLDAINSLEAEFNEQFQSETSRREFRRSVERGREVANAILEWAATDGFDVLNNCTYAPAPVPGAWKPTPPAFNPNPLQPCWGQLRPMVLDNLTECAASSHPAFSTDPASEFYAAGKEVYDVRVNLTDEQETIALYWADNPVATGTPPGHWIAIVGQFARNEPLSLFDAAEAFARVGIAVHDAFVQSWNDKFITNLQRPVTFIQENIDQTWLPLLITPNFPTYSSGHSTQSGAATFLLTDMFGERNFTDTTHTDHELVPTQTPREFDSFEEAGAEAAVSRLYEWIGVRTMRMECHCGIGEV